MDHPLGVRLGAEALGTFIFFFFGFSGIAVVVDIGADAITPLGVAAGFGFGLALAITAFGHLSGGHFNPAVSAGLAVAGRFPSRNVVPYWIAQLVGGFGAVLVMAIVYSGDVTDSLHTAPGSGIDDWAALVLEIVATALFVMVILTVDRRSGPLEGCHGAAPDRALHLHCGDRSRPRVGRLLQPRSLARPGPLQPGVGRCLDLPPRAARRRRARWCDLVMGRAEPKTSKRVTGAHPLTRAPETAGLSSL